MLLIEYSGITFWKDSLTVHIHILGSSICSKCTYKLLIYIKRHMCVCIYVHVLAIFDISKTIKEQIQISERNCINTLWCSHLMQYKIAGIKILSVYPLCVIQLLKAGCIAVSII